MGCDLAEDLLHLHRPPLAIYTSLLDILNFLSKLMPGIGWMFGSDLYSMLFMLFRFIYNLWIEFKLDLPSNGDR